jgi:hypothetical protein
MPKWLKVVLVLMVMGALGLGTCIGGVAWWATANKDKMVDGVRTARVEGEAFGRAHAKTDCVDDALTHVKSCGPVDFMCEAFTKMRLTSCMSVAADDDVCKGAPARSEIVKSALWANAECSRRGEDGSQPCGRLMQAVVEGCDATAR